MLYRTIKEPEETGTVSLPQAIAAVKSLEYSRRDRLSEGQRTRTAYTSSFAASKHPRRRRAVHGRKARRAKRVSR